MIVASIATPRWVTYSVTTPLGDRLEKHIGLHKSCSTLDEPHCRPFPHRELCQAGQRYFCDMWKTIGFLSSLSVVLCLACLVTFVVVMRGGKYKRETGWPFVTVMMGLVSGVEFLIISMVAYLYDHDKQFIVPGWKLDISWIFGTVGASLCLLISAGLTTSAFVLPPEDGYNFLEDPVDS
ncbi:hypothetical protein GMORB2_6974 [Geosmithia morbida]|uniref:Pre-mRNA splicing factor n=1 Tax=Geosmithia morbida TaxID=1094350 RepID=A0A9P4YU96_9HYPO|nr:uncharacterized protein GMORB2_6974 [Geosmithia morbida]KAF4122667.1 hypothetical protein GMORB2_6974 [Geosmithia morbida]